MATAAQKDDPRQIFTPALALVKRELLVPARTRGALAILLAILLLGAMIVLNSYPRNDISWGYLPNLATEIVLWLTVLLIVGIAVIVPGVAANAILGERNTGNWDSLSLTLIRPPWIIAAKLLCVVARYLILVAAFAPVYASVLFLIGFDWRQIISLIALLAATTLTCAAMGLGCSAIFRSMTRAILASYAAMSCLMGLPLLVLIVVVLMLGGAGWLGTWLQQNAWTFSPLAVLAGFAGGSTNFDHFYSHLAYQGAYALAGLTMTWIGIRRIQEPALPPKRGKRSRTAAPLSDAAAGTSAWLHPGRNPIYQREVRWGSGFNARRARIAVPLGLVYFGGITFAFLGLFRYDPQPQAQEIAFSIILHGASLCCVVPALFANTFTKERERKNNDMLHATLMTPQEIVGGKFRVAMMFFAAMWLISLISNAPIWLRHPPEHVYRWTALMGHGTILVAGLFSVAITLRFGMRVKHTATAIVGGQVLVLAANVGFFILAMLVIEIFRFSGYINQDFIPYILFVSPSISFFVWIDRSMETFPFITYWITNTLVFCGITYLVYRGAVSRYAKYLIQER